MRCERCGNENPDTNRFCGMCAASLSASPSPTRAVAAPPVEPPALPSFAPAASAHAEPRRPAPVDDAPVITGPSFLGLNKPAASGGRGAPPESPLDHLRSSRNLDYLLDDDQPEPRRGFFKVLLVLAALALALGFGYLRWKQGGFDWITTEAKKSPAAQAPDSSQAPADAAAPAANPAATTVPSASSATAGADSAPTNPPSAGTAPVTSPASAPVANPVASTPATSADSGSASNAPAASTVAPVAPADSGTSAAAPTSASGAPAKTPEADAPPANAIRPAKPTPAKPVDPVAVAEKYIYGRGVPQDCDRGLRQLKVEQSNPKAMISLGALYSTGVCTPRDLPTAYRWFALALRKQPDNESLQQDLQKLWSQMTQPERQLAIKLSQ